MTVKDLIAVLGAFPADMPVGSIHTCMCCTSVEPVEPRHVRLGTIEHTGAMSPSKQWWCEHYLPRAEHDPRPEGGTP